MSVSFKAGAPVNQHFVFAVMLVAIILCQPPNSSAIDFLGEAPPPSESLSLWYRKPATDWVSALPIGNGRLGAMVFGGIEQERLQLNEDTLWGGGPYDPDSPEALAVLPEVRKLIFNRNYVAAADLISKKVMARPLKQMPYQTVGDLLLTFPVAKTVENYRRDLNLDAATATVSYSCDGVRYTREVFASAPDQVIVMRLSADQPGKISVVAGMKTPMSATIESDGKNTLVMRGSGGDAEGIHGALKYQARATVVASGGNTSAGNAAVSVTDADQVTIFIAAATTFKKYDDVSGDAEGMVKRRISRAVKKSFDTLHKAQMADHQQLFRRVSLDLGRSELMGFPTDERIGRFAEGNDSPLAALYYQFGRYLLISSSRPGGQPANLQGLWNDSPSPHGAANTRSISIRK